MRLSAFLRAGQLAGLATLIAASSGACANEFDTTRRAPAPLTLGDDMFQVLCDRVAATADPFDLEGRKSRVVCHPDGDGKYGGDYLEADQPMPPKVAVMVRYRPQMIEAFNSIFPDKDSLQTDMRDLMKAMVPLYDDDTLPESTRTLAAIFETVGFDQTKPKKDESPIDANARKNKLARAEEVRAALARLGGRKGYRTIPTAIGVARPLLSYPELAKVVGATIKLLGAGGPAEPEMRKVLEVAQLELANTTVDPARAPITGYKDRFSGVANQKPKLTSEILKNLLVDPPPLKADLSGPAYAATWSDPYAADGAGGALPTVPFLIRDARGFAAFTSMPGNALDKDGDGLTDIDAAGRFLGRDGKPLGEMPPFAYVTAGGLESGKGPRDDLGRALVTAGGATLYRYGDASKTMLHAVLVDTQTLANPANGALLDLMHGASYQFGARLDTKRSYDDPDGSTEKIPVKYKKFDTQTAPLGDLVYALGQALALPRMNDYLELTRQLLRDHADVAARLTGAALKVREISQKPEYAGINLDPKSPLWDEVIELIGQMAAEPDVMRDVLDSFGDPRVLLLPAGMARFAQHTDVLDYNPAADSCWAMGAKADASCPQLNDPYWNVTQGGPKKDTAQKADWTKDDEANRTLFARFLSLINDASGVRSCNRDGGTINTKLGFIPVKLPLFGTYKECEVLNVPDLAKFYLGCIAGGNIDGTSTPRCKLPVTDGLVSALNTILGSGNVDKLLEGSSGITGLKQTPTLDALNRLVMWRNPNKFVSDLIEPMTSNVCPKSGPNDTRKCASSADLLANRQRGTIFMGEAYDAIKGLAPVVTPFVKRRGDGKGREQFFIGLVSIMHRHWGDGTNKVRCDTAVPGKECNGTGLRKYEPILAEAFATDIIPALHESVKVLKGMSVNGKPGTEVLAALVRDLTDPKTAATLKLTDRKGNAATTTNDGKAVPQTTLFYLFANAINGFDTMWSGAKGPADHDTWRAARSKVVDQFLAVDAAGGDVTKSQFKNAGVRTAGPILIDLLDDRIAEHKAKGDFDTWAKSGLLKSFTDSLEGPTFAAVIDLTEKIYADKDARTQLGNLIVYLASQASANDALRSVLTAAQDIMQIAGDDTNMVPLYHAAAVAASPDGALKRSLDLVERLDALEKTAEFAGSHDNRRVIPKVLANAVTPIGKTQITPIEILMDVIADLHRADPTQKDPFAPLDYGSVSKNVQDFLVDPTRGLEQLYAIVKNRNVE